MKEEKLTLTNLGLHAVPVEFLSISWDNIMVLAIMLASLINLLDCTLHLERGYVETCEGRCRLPRIVRLIETLHVIFIRKDKRSNCKWDNTRSQINIRIEYNSHLLLFVPSISKIQEALATRFNPTHLVLKMQFVCGKSMGWSSYLELWRWCLHNALFSPIRPQYWEMFCSSEKMVEYAENAGRQPEALRWFSTMTSSC